MTVRQAKAHGGSKHCSQAETATFFNNPGNFTAVEILKWRCRICHGRPKTRKQARSHETKKGHYSRVATSLFNHPGIFKYVGNGKWHCHICKGAGMTKGMTIKEAKVHEILCQGPNFDLNVASSAGKNHRRLPSSRRRTSTKNVVSSRASERLEVAESDSEAGSLDRSLDGQSEGNGNATSIIHREGAAFERNDSNDSEDDDEDEDDEVEDDEDEDDDDADNNKTDNDNADNNADNANNNNHIADDDDGHDDATFVENFLRCHDVDADRRKRLRSFYKMSADQKIQKIQEMLRGQ